MVSINNIKGKLLEIVLLYLLRLTGYKTITSIGNDPSLTKAQNGGIAVKGRGEKHEIDGIADFRIQHPFSYPQRLLVEAKCFAPPKKVGISIAREAVGVLKDVNEFWIGSKNNSRIKRYHYQYAIFSATGYTKPTQRYSYAQDVYLISLQNSKFFKPILDTIQSISLKDFNVEKSKDIKIDLVKLIKYFRGLLENNGSTDIDIDEISTNSYHDFLRKLNKIKKTTNKLNFGLLAVIGNRFPVFLVPNKNINIDKLSSFYKIHITWNKKSWYIKKESGEELFSFDLPPELFELYARDGVLTPINAIKLKGHEMTEFYAYQTKSSDDEEKSDKVKIIRFVIDEKWYKKAKADVERMKQDLASSDTETQ